MYLICMSQVSFEKLYDQLFDRILNFVFRRVGDFDVANDITSDVFLKVYERLWTFKWRGIPMEIWVFRIATNEVNQHFRRGRSQQNHYRDIRAHLQQEMDVNTYVKDREQAEEALIRHTKFMQVLKVIKQLDVKYQEVLALRYFENFTLDEIAQVTGKKMGTVKSLLSRGTEQARAILGVQPFEN